MAKITFGEKHLTKPKKIVHGSDSNLLLYWPCIAESRSAEDPWTTATKELINHAQGGIGSLDGTIHHPIKTVAATVASWGVMKEGSRPYVSFDGHGARGMWIGNRLAELSGRPIDLPGFPTENFAIQFWLRVNTEVSDNELKRVMTYGGHQHGDHTCQLQLNWSPGDRFELERTFDHDTNDSNSDTTGAMICIPADTTWQMVTIVCGTDTMKVFMNDGKLEGYGYPHYCRHGEHTQTLGGSSTNYPRGQTKFKAIKRPSISFGKNLDNTSMSCPMYLAEVAIYGDFSSTDLDSTSSEWFKWFWTGTNRNGQTGSHDIFPENIRKNFWARRMMFNSDPRIDAQNYEASALKV